MSYQYQHSPSSLHRRSSCQNLLGFSTSLIQWLLFLPKHQKPGSSEDPLIVSHHSLWLREGIFEGFSMNKRNTTGTPYARGEWSLIHC